MACNHRQTKRNNSRPASLRAGFAESPRCHVRLVELVFPKCGIRASPFTSRLATASGRRRGRLARSASPSWHSGSHEKETAAQTQTPLILQRIISRQTSRFYWNIRFTGDSTTGQSAEGRRGRLNYSASVRTGGYVPESGRPVPISTCRRWSVQSRPRRQISHHRAAFSTVIPPPVNRRLCTRPPDPSLYIHPRLIKETY